jgi:hypothetical protein
MERKVICNVTEEEVAKSFIEDVEQVKELLPRCNAMEFPDTFDEFADSYGILDREEVYTNGALLIPVFRVKQWLEHVGQEG